jgi:hypothetical protein
LPGRDNRGIDAGLAGLADATNDSSVLRTLEFGMGRGGNSYAGYEA